MSLFIRKDSSKKEMKIKKACVNLTITFNCIPFVVLNDETSILGNSIHSMEQLNGPITENNGIIVQGNGFITSNHFSCRFCVKRYFIYIEVELRDYNANFHNISKHSKLVE